MANEWVNRIYLTTTGALVATVPCSASSWMTRMTGQGAGTFDIQVEGSGISRANLEEWTTPNEYTITQEWAPTDHVVFAGVIQEDDWDDTTDTVTVSAVELRGAYFNNRMLWPLSTYNTTGGGGTATALEVVDRSRAAAVRAVLETAQFGGAAPAVFPLDLPADAAGDFSATWLYNERLFVEDHLTQIEEDGCETYLRPYRDGSGNLRYEVKVQDGRLKYGTVTTFPIRGASSPVRNLRVKRDGINQMTGVGVFGEGGKEALMQWGPDPIPATFAIPLRDVWINRSDLDTESRLRSVGNQQYAVLQYPSSAWRFDLHIYPDGPEYAGVGRELWMNVGTHPRLTNGDHKKRVIALRGDMGFFVTPEVDDAY
jgi:hypothetical protein